MSLLTLSLLPLAVALIAGGLALYVLNQWQPDASTERWFNAARATAVVAGLVWLGIYSVAQSQENSIDPRPQTKRERFCAKHEGIGDWRDARGYRVRCSDGTYSFSGGISGSCSSHGGNRPSFGN